MNRLNKKPEVLSFTPENSEHIANTYVMRCFTVTMIVYLATFLLNLVGIFTIEHVLPF